MPVFSANGKTMDADLFVFDKDGLMFDSAQFWLELSNARCSRLLTILSDVDALEWMRLTGADTTIDNDTNPYTTHVNPLGILAVASPFEERTVLAGFLVGKLGLPWHEARDIASSVFEYADKHLDLSKAIKPQPGYINLMQSLMSHNIPYGVATSDTLQRTKDSMSLYGCWDKVQFVVTPEDVANGKPAPDMLQLISHNTGVPLDRIVMIGDSYVDVKMANAAGCMGIGVSTDPEMRKKMEPYATVVLSSLEEIII